MRTARALLGWFVLAVALAAPARAGTVRYAVTYLELRPAAAPDGARVLAAYAARGRKEDGNLGFVALAETRPGRFALLETWNSRAALARHWRDPETARRLRQLEPLRTAPDDRRMYDGLYAAAPDGARAGAVHVMTHVDVMPPFAVGCAGLLKQMRADTPRDPGNSGYDVLRLEHETNHFTVAETWASRQAFDAHLAASHTIAFRKKLLPMTGALYDERIFTEIP